MTTLRTGRPEWRRLSPKYSDHGVERTVAPAQTIRRVMPLMDRIGVTRVGDVTGLDRVGLPNFTAVRPREVDDGISYYNGKGLTRDSARAGALMEALERYSGERCDLPVYYGDRAELERTGPVVDPADIVLPLVTEYQPDLRIEWVEGFDLLGERPTYVPLNAVVCPYAPPEGRTLLYRSSTNGLASGNILAEALCHAVCEVVERDALAIASAYRELAPAIGRVLAGIGGPNPAAAPSPARFPLIDLESLPARARLAVAKLKRAGLLVYLRDITCIGVPTFECTVVEHRWDDRHLVHGGSGAHPDARVAACRALTEAAQSRVGHIQGGREDLPEIVRDQVAFDPDDVYGGGEIRPFSAVESNECDTVDGDVRFLLDRLRAEGFPQVVVVDLTRPEFGVPVVRAVVPCAESWSVYFSHIRRTAFGPRVTNILRGVRGRVSEEPAGA
ncbi:YcaO-like family protein [Pseudonocardia adelaidensis]|uniref:YcaO-related McrA-glycine thioamidation protein n=1 Tax=Pseudonocardia adelaidensis TaxID=648754 RepID=A0ABP9NIL2_9PSEU